MTYPSQVLVTTVGPDPACAVNVKKEGGAQGAWLVGLECIAEIGDMYLYWTRSGVTPRLPTPRPTHQESQCGHLASSPLSSPTKQPLHG